MKKLDLNKAAIDLAHAHAGEPDQATVETSINAKMDSLKLPIAEAAHFKHICLNHWRVFFNFKKQDDAAESLAKKEAKTKAETKAKP